MCPADSRQQACRYEEQAPSSIAWKRRPSNRKAQSICKTSNQKTFQQLDQRLLLTRRNDADFEVN